MNRVWGLTFVFSLVLFSCENNPISEGQTADDKVVLKGGEESLSYNFKDEVEFSKVCLEELREGNLEVFHQFAEKKILLSPYAYIDQANFRKVSIAEIETPNDDIHFWGIYDGRGDSILMTTPEYLNRYILNFPINSDGVEINVYEDKPKAYGSELHNMHEIYPNATFVEFYHPPSEEGYMDWNALIFVVEIIKHDYGNEYLLKAIVHNQWTV
ncbi:MAG TPA: hypothetical protein VKY37_12305 [Brumimicrobium sp.]|nr:hypothetical protein [Brumimicrobium sp.]